MELIQLRYFQTVAQLQHITKAAEQLHISQPALSSAISRLEAEIGIDLFDRRGRNIYLNHFGQIVLRNSQEIFAKIEKMEMEIQEALYQKTQNISFGTNNVMLLTRWLGDFSVSNPGLRITQKIASAKQLEEELLLGKTDFIVLHRPLLDEAFQKITIHQDEIVAIVTDEHPLAIRKSIQMEELMQQSFLCQSPDPHMERLIDILLEGYAFNPDIVFEGSKDMFTRMIVSQKKQGVILSLRSLYQGLGMNRFSLSKEMTGADQDTQMYILSIAHPACSIQPTIHFLKENCTSYAQNQFLIFMQKYDFDMEELSQNSLLK